MSIPADRLRDCVHCGLCLNACPTYLELGTEMDSPRGRIYLMEKLTLGELSLSADVVRHFDLCLGCRACETACPSGVHYGELIEGARELVASNVTRGWRERWLRKAIAAVFPYPKRLHLLLAPVRLAERLGFLKIAKRWINAANLLPNLHTNTSTSKSTNTSTNTNTRILQFEGCVNKVLFSETNAATRRILERAGARVESPSAQVCCGALHLHAGDRARAKEFARVNLTAFGESGDAIAVNAAGCGAMLKEYGALLADEPAYAERARSFSGRVRDISELVAVAKHEATHQPSKPARRVAYHDACHLAHAQGIREQPRALLKGLPGVECVELEEADVCCGAAGSYSLTEPELANRLGDRKAARIAASGADCVAVGNPGCALQIRAALARRGSDIEVVHPIELADRTGVEVKLLR